MKTTMGVLTVLFILMAGPKQCDSLQATVNSFEIRGASDEFMPQHVIAKLTTVDNVRVDLNLRLVPHLDGSLPVEYISIDEEGQLVTRTEHTMPSNDVSYYQDVHYKAAIQLKRYWDRTHELFSYNMRGHVIFNDSIFYLDTEKNASQSEARYRFPTPFSNEPPVQIVSLEGQQINLVLEKPVKGFRCQEHFVDNDSRGGTQGKKRMPPRRTNKSRKSRESKEYFLDILTVVGYGLYTQMKEAMKQSFTTKVYEHFAFLFNEVDLLYKNLDAQYTLNIRLVKIVLAEDKNVSSYLESIASMGKIDASASLQLLQTFTNAKANEKLKNQSDHVMVFTSYDLYSETNGVQNTAIAGIANTGRMCSRDGTSCSIIEHHDNGFMVAIIVAHELGHSLSSYHDGSDNNCTAADRYIMAPSNSPETETTVLNPFKFSRCSVKYFTEFIEKLLQNQEGRDCLTKSNTVSSDIPNVSHRLLGLEMTPDQQCEDLLGEGSFFCRPEAGADSKICTNLMCSNPTNSSYCVFYTPHSGTTCGKKKICRHGRCVDDPRGPDVDDNCVFGDPPGRVVNNQTCKETLAQYPNACDTPQFSSICCESCGNDGTSKGKGDVSEPTKSHESTSITSAMTEALAATDVPDNKDLIQGPTPKPEPAPMTTTVKSNMTMTTSSRAATPAASNTSPKTTTTSTAARPTSTAARPVSCAEKMYNQQVFLFSCLCYFLLCQLNM